MFLIYHSQYNPSNLTGAVGGDIGSTQLSGYLNELFYHVAVPPSGINTTSHQYRKVFIKNTYPNSSTNTRIWLDSVEHEQQISISRSASLSDTSTTPTGQPSTVTGWVTPYNYSEGLNLGAITTNAYTGFWIRQSLSGIYYEDPFATFRLNIGGLVE